jgi:hypothetical protein
MTSLASILAATDLSTDALASLRSAASMAEQSGAAAHVFHCVPRSGPFGPWTLGSEASRQAEAEALRPV